MAVSVAIANLSIRPMDVELYSIALSSRTRLLDRIALRVANPGNSFRAFATPSPLITIRNYMNWFCHFLVSPMSSSHFDTPSCNWHLGYETAKALMEPLQESTGCSVKPASYWSVRLFVLLLDAMHCRKDMVTESPVKSFCKHGRTRQIFPVFFARRGRSVSVTPRISEALKNVVSHNA